VTISLVAKSDTSDLYGVAITSSSICVASRCSWVKSKVGAVSTQNITLPSLGPMILDEITQGKNVTNAMNDVMAQDTFSAYRQVIAIDKTGETSWFNGNHALGVNNISHGKNCIAAGNLLASSEVTNVMIDEFLSSDKNELAEKMLQAMDAGIAAGGEAGPLHSAGLLVIGENDWPSIDLRVDWTDNNPLTDLRVLWEAYAPQMHDYVTRAIDPTTAPAYGVPGDEE
jgi:uncharacterized Ntn-hydrolase superfamily protein